MNRRGFFGLVTRGLLGTVIAQRAGVLERLFEAQPVSYASVVSANLAEFDAILKAIWLPAIVEELNKPNALLSLMEMR